MAMINPSVSDLLTQAECRYVLVVKVSKRAREIVSGAQPLIDTRETKAVSIAIDEINEGLISHLPPQEADA